MSGICHWEITKRCNLSCIHCISATKNRKELDTKRALQVIENLNRLRFGELYITGGEPLLRKDICEILKKAKQKKFKVGVLTKGILINKKNIKKIKFFVDEIGISLDGSSSRINDRIRGAGTFKKIIKAIVIVKEYKIPLGLYITLNKQNLDDLKNILRLINFLRVDFVRINEVSLRGRAYRNKNLLKINVQTRKNYLEKIITDALGDKIFQGKRLFLNEKCNINSETIFLSSRGYIYPCVEIFQKNSYCHIGNILQITPEKFQKYQKILSKIIIKEKCPYMEIKIKNFSLCLNVSFIKNCSIMDKICQLKKLTR